MNSMSEAHIKTEDEVASNSPAESEPGDDLEDELRPEYDSSSLKNGVRGKYLAQYRSGMKNLQEEKLNVQHER